MKKYYISHPYTGNELYNVKESEVITTRLAKAHPDALFTNPLIVLRHTGYAQLSYDNILEKCLELLSLCDGIIMTGDYENSAGCKIEYQYAKEHGIPCDYNEWNTL